MLVKFDELKVLQTAEELADELWDVVIKWGDFLKNTIGQQLIRAVASIGANIAESYGRYHYGEKIQFLYYSRGSLFEAKYWLNRANKRQLLPPDVYDLFATRLSALVHQLNTFLKSIKDQRNRKKVREPGPYYETSANSYDQFLEQYEDTDLFSQDDIASLSKTSNSNNQPNQPDQPNQP